MVNLPQSDISKPPNHVKPPTVDLCSPDVIKKTHKAGLKVVFTFCICLLLMHLSVARMFLCIFIEAFYFLSAGQ